MDNSPDRIEGEPLRVVPDANVLVHGRSLVDQPWHVLGRDPIEIVLIPPVIRELDKLKVQTGRPNKVARALSSDVRRLLKEPDRTATVRRSGPAVTKRVELRKVTTAVVDGLDLGHADQALINYALHLQADGQDILLLTDDTICATTAEEFGLPVLLIDDDWLRDAEPDEASKENLRLAAENRRLKAAEPQVALSFVGMDGAVLSTFEAEIVRWPALTSTETDALMTEVANLCPPASSFEPLKPRATDALRGIGATQRFGHLASLQPRTAYEPATEEEIEDYRTQKYPDWLDEVRTALGSLHDTLQARFEPPWVLAVAANKGTRPAQDTLLSMVARGDFAIRDEDVPAGEDDDADEASPITVPYALPLPPNPPRGRTRTMGALGGRSAFGADAIGRMVHHPLHLPTFSAPKPRDSDAFYWREGRDGWVDQMQLECASWRHGQDEVVSKLGISPDGLEPCSGAIELSVHASNLSDPALVRLPVRIMVTDGDTLGRARALIAVLARAVGGHGWR